MAELGDQGHGAGGSAVVDGRSVAVTGQITA